MTRHRLQRRHLYSHKFFFCPQCCQHFNDRADFDGHFCGRASICVYLECQNRHDGLRNHNYRKGCPSSFKNLDTKPKWYAIFALALPDLQPPAWGTTIMMLLCSNRLIYSDYVCVPANNGDGSTQFNVDDAGASQPDSAELRQLCLTGTPVYAQTQTPRYHDNTPVNGMRAFNNINPRLSTSPAQAGRYSNLPTGQTQLDYPSQEFNVQSWSREPLYEQHSLQMTGLNQPAATHTGDIRAHNASNASFDHAAEGWPLTEPFEPNYGDSYEDFALTGDYTYREFESSRPSQGRPSDKRF